MEQFDFITLRLGKTSVPDIQKINKLPSGRPEEPMVINVTSTQVPSEVQPGNYVLIWLGSDNNKGQVTEWKQGFKVFGKVVNLSRGEKWSDESTTSVELLYVFSDAVSRQDLLQHAPREYYYCSSAPIIGLDDHSNQTIRLFDSGEERSDIHALFCAFDKILPSFKDDLLRILPGSQKLFVWGSSEANKGPLDQPPSADELRDAFHRYLIDPSRFKDKNTGPRYWNIITSDRPELQFLKGIISSITNGRADSIFSVSNVHEAESIHKTVLKAPENSFQSKSISAILGCYWRFLVDYLQSRKGSEKEKCDVPRQIIYFGAPGTGKSYKIKHEVIPEGIEPYRVTFYSDFYYSDFVGGLRPQKSADNGIDYRFEAGPFARALKDSFSKPTYLIIEEINRGNAAAIFGDIFQLLDREEGVSEYAITNHDLYQYLVKEGITVLEEDKVYIPSNLYILCTMNTADQNVFVLDTAFKRRFKMEYVPIDFNAYFVNNNPENGVKTKCRGYLDNVAVFNGGGYEGDLKLVMTPDIFDAVAKTIGTPIRDWRTFASFVNARIDAINKIEQKISEDKKLGPFFVDEEELNDRKTFADKVLYYLKQDVFKYEDSILEDSYEVLYDRFVNKGEDIFKLISPAR
jgi:hypothetical protein